MQLSCAPISKTIQRDEMKIMICHPSDDFAPLQLSKRGYNIYNDSFASVFTARFACAGFTSKNVMLLCYLEHYAYA